MIKNFKKINPRISSVDIKGFIKKNQMSESKRILSGFSDQAVQYYSVTMGWIRDPRNGRFLKKYHV